MIQRYTNPEMGAIWSDARRYETWLEVELAAADAMADAGIIPRRRRAEMRAKAAFDIARIEEIEAVTQHDVIAFTTAVAEKVGPAARWLHFGLTSSDVIDGGKEGKQPGVMMAEGSTLDGFTITNVGKYDEAIWKKHFDSQGEELGDEEGSVQAEGTTPAIRYSGRDLHRHQLHRSPQWRCRDRRPWQREDEDRPAHHRQPRVPQHGRWDRRGRRGGTDHSGQHLQGEPAGRDRLPQSQPDHHRQPVLSKCPGGNRLREGSKPVMRGNKCFKNRRAGIGIRMEDTAPVVEANECYENEMAGIGCRDGASPILRTTSAARTRWRASGVGTEPSR